MRRPRYEANEKTSWVSIVSKNFVGGLMWGLGSVIGASVVLVMISRLLSPFEFIPAIADMVLQIQNIVDARR